MSAFAESVMRPEDYNDQILKNETELEHLEEGLRQIRGLPTNIRLGGGSKADKAKLDALYQQYGTEKELEARIEDLKAENWKYQNALKYGTLNENEDYEEMAAKRADVKKGGFGIGFGTKWWGQGDPVYHYINNIDGAGEAVRKGENDYAVYDFMTEEEKADYNYLYNTQGKKSAQEYLDYIQYDLEHRQMNTLKDQMDSFATKYPATASALRVVTNLGSGIGVLDVFGQNIKREITGKYEPIHYERGSMAPTAVTSTITGTVAKNIADSTGTIDLDEEEHPVLSRILNGKSLGDVYQLGMSMVDSGAIALMTMAGIPGGTALLGGSAASQGVLDALEKGASDSQALSMGILNGTFEMLFEEVSLDKLVNGNSGKLIRDMLVQGGVEGSEEFCTTLANTVADILVMADKSDYKTAVARYMDQGNDEGTATRKFLLDVAIGMGWDFMGGFLSGMPMAGMARPVQNFAQGVELKKSGVTMEELSSLGSTYGQNSKVNRLSENGKGGTYAMGRLYTQISTQLSQQNRADIAKTLESKGMDPKIAKKHAQILEGLAEGAPCPTPRCG